MKKLSRLLLLLVLTGAACQQKDPAGSPVDAEASALPHSQAVAASPSLHPMQEALSMNAITIYTSRENIRATATGYLQKVYIQQGSSLKGGQSVFSLQTKEAAALGEEILQDSSINITGIIPIVAKNSGIVTQVFFQEGDYVVDGDVLAELTKPNSLAIKLYVPYEYNQHIQAQSRVQVRLPDGEILNGIVKQLLPSEDIASQTTPYLVTISPFRFLPENLNVTVTVATKSNNNALAVPRKAVQSDEEQTQFWVMKMVNDTLAIRLPVNLGMRTDSLIELINSPLTPADQIIIEGAYGLPDTAIVTLVNTL